MRSKLQKLQHRLFNLKVGISAILAFLPLILIALNGEIRPSISDYAYSEYNYVFVSALSIAGAMFMYKGSAEKKVLSIIVGIALIAVANKPHLQHPIAHYTSAVIFFLGSSIMFIVEGKREHAKVKIALSLLIALAVLFSAFGMYSLLLGESIAIIPIVLNNGILKLIK